MTSNNSQALLRLDNVVKEFGRRRTLIRRRTDLTRALDGVTLDVHDGESLGLVGESGSGKTTLGRILVRAERPTSGQVLFKQRSLGAMRGRELRQYRRRVQMVFQNPFTSLNPRRTVRDVLSSGFTARGLPRGAAQDAEMNKLLERVGLNESILDRYPHTFSGGQRQRIVLARALTVNPTVLVADEPVSALDVSIQAQVLNLLISLRRELGLTVLMITHDLRIANFFCDRIAVLYRGQLVELGPRSAVMDAPRHPYTRMLLSAAPTGDPDANPQRPWLRAERGANIGDASAAGCAFSARCALREMLGNPSRCVSQRPGLAAVGPDHQAACHYQDQLPDALTNGDVAAAEATA